VLASLIYGRSRLVARLGLADNSWSVVYDSEAVNRNGRGHSRHVITAAAAAMMLMLAKPVESPIRGVASCDPRSIDDLSARSTAIYVMNLCDGQDGPCRRESVGRNAVRQAAAQYRESIGQAV